jgi:hypothetical protein
VPEGFTCDCLVGLMVDGPAVHTPLIFFPPEPGMRLGCKPVPFALDDVKDGNLACRTHSRMGNREPGDPESVS